MSMVTAHRCAGVSSGMISIGVWHERTAERAARVACYHGQDILIDFGVD